MARVVLRRHRLAIVETGETDPLPTLEYDLVVVGGALDTGEAIERRKPDGKTVTRSWLPALAGGCVTMLVASGFSLEMPCQLRGTSKCPSLRNFGASIRAV